MVRKTFLFGLAIVAASTLMLEIVLTRVFSVIMWYHMSLVAVSMAMFGMTLGALVVHRRPEWFRPENVARACSRSALWFAVVDVALAADLPEHAVQGQHHQGPESQFAVHHRLLDSVAALPFVFSGICVCAALTRFPRSVGKLYASDLVGAASGCVAIVCATQHGRRSQRDHAGRRLDDRRIARLRAGNGRPGHVSGPNRAGAGASASSLCGTIRLTPSGCSTRSARTSAVKQLRHEYWNSFSYVGVSRTDLHTVLSRRRLPAGRGAVLGKRLPLHHDGHPGQHADGPVQRPLGRRSMVDVRRHQPGPQHPPRWAGAGRGDGRGARRALCPFFLRAVSARSLESTSTPS